MDRSRLTFPTCERCEVVKVREMIRELERDGWIQVRQRGSHRQFFHPLKAGTVTVAGHPEVDPRLGHWSRSTSRLAC